MKSYTLGISEEIWNDLQKLDKFESKSLNNEIRKLIENNLVEYSIKIDDDDKVTQTLKKYVEELKSFKTEFIEKFECENYFGLEKFLMNNIKVKFIGKFKHPHVEIEKNDNSLIEYLKVKKNGKLSKSFDEMKNIVENLYMCSLNENLDKYGFIDEYNFFDKDASDLYFDTFFNIEGDNLIKNNKSESETKDIISILSMSSHKKVTTEDVKKYIQNDNNNI